MRIQGRGTARWFRTVLAGCTVLALLLAACGGDDNGDAGGGGNESENGADGELVSITVHDTAGVGSAYAAFAIENGLYEEHGLDVTVEPVQGGVSSVPALVSGEIQMAGSNSTSVLLAVDQGLALKAVGSSTVSNPSGEEDFAGLLVRDDSDINSKQDLEGKTIAVNALASLPELAVRSTLDRAGVDLSKVEITEVPFPEMHAALQRGDVDAISAIEPFMTGSLADGARALYYHFSEMVPDVQVGVYAVSAQYAEENPDVVQSLSDALAENAAYVRDNPDEFREFLVENAEMTPELADQIILPRWNEEIDFGSLEALAELMQEYGITEQVPDVSQLML